MIDVGVCQKNACDWTVAWRVESGVQFRRAFALLRQIRRGVDQEPLPGSFGADRDARLRLQLDFPGARSDAVGACTVPLWQAAAGRAAENMDANQPEFSESLISFDQTAPA